MAQHQGLGEDGAPGVQELDDEGHWTSLATQHWSKLVDLRKIRPEVVKKEIWDKLESLNFEFRSLVMLENLQLLEKSKFVAFGYHNPL